MTAIVDITCKGDPEAAEVLSAMFTSEVALTLIRGYQDALAAGAKHEDLIGSLIEAAPGIFFTGVTRRYDFPEEAKREMARRPAAFAAFSMSPGPDILVVAVVTAELDAAVRLNIRPTPLAPGGQA